METEGKFHRVGHVARKTLLFQVELPEESWTAFHPGQYAYLEWIDPPVTDEKGSGRNFSIVSPPKELPLLSFATRLTGSAFKKCLEDLPDGSPIRVSGPFGEFLLPACFDSTRALSWEKPVVFVAGGIGITPFRSMLLDSLDRCTAISFFLFTTNHTLEDSAFREEIESLARTHKNLYLDQIVSHASTPLPPGVEVGHLTPGRLFETVGGKARNGDFYIAGTPSMVSSFKNALLGAGVLTERIHVDPFMGYF
ncbi:MAG: FAD-dependent oxidoreductase [Leptospirales bacterium]